MNIIAHSFSNPYSLDVYVVTFGLDLVDVFMPRIVNIEEGLWTLQDLGVVSYVYDEASIGIVPAFT